MIKQTVRFLRENQTKAEATLWRHLRNRKFKGKKFVRQFPVEFEYMGKNRFVVIDFYCHQEKLGIEIDGSVHDNKKEFDAYRETILAQKEIRIIRFANNEVLDKIPYVLEKITTFFQKQLTPRPPLLKERGKIQQ